MSELKATTAQEIVRNEKDCDYMDELFGGVKMPPTQVYIKSEADKVIADLEESHKMEVEQLLMEIVELKADYKEACGRLQTANLIKDEQLAATRHHKYKRCLSEASYWVAVSFQCVDDKHRQKAERHHRKWLELAEQFKEAK